MKTLIALLVAILALAGVAHAIVVTPTGATADVDYTEPATNADGTPLTDLSHCNVYAKPATDAEIKFPNVPASAPTGGAARTVNIAVAALPGASTSYAVTASCTDLTGNESLRSPVVNLVVDRLAPAPPK